MWLPGRLVVAGMVCSLLTGHEPLVHASLILPESVALGERAWVGVRLILVPEWHVYWQSPGDSGLATTVVWTTPAGVTMGPLAWPLPVRFDDAGVVGYGYRDEVVLLSELRVDRLAPGGSLSVSARVRWLACHDVCVSGSAMVDAQVRIAAPTVPAAELRPWLARVPVEPATGVLSVGDGTWRRHPGGWILDLPLAGPVARSRTEVFVVPPTTGSVDHATIRMDQGIARIPFTALPAAGSTVTLVLPMQTPQAPGTSRASADSGPAADPVAYELTTALPAAPTP